MNFLDNEALRIVLIMQRDMHFAIDFDSILCNPVHTSTDIHILLDTQGQEFYDQYFSNICTQMQLLVALGHHSSAEDILSKVKSDLSCIVEKATKSAHHIVFSIPELEACLVLNPHLK